MKPKINESSTTPTISLPPSILTSLMTSKFNAKYENVSESEKKVIRVSLNGDDKEKESLFTEMIRETIDILNVKLETSNVDLKDKLLKTKDKLLRTEYKSETFTKDITKIFSLKDDLTK
jgi:bifunctional ADP-heptose synthase (sugar kinase/adenylyltransferase)